MRRRIIWAGFAALLLAACGPSGGGGGLAGCDLSGFIDATQILDPANCNPYHVTGDLTVTDSGRLEIKPGTTLEFAQDTGLYVQDHGALVAVGTASDKILFTGASKVRGYWKGVIVGGNSFDNELKYVEIEYAGADERWDPGAFASYRAAVELGEDARLKMTDSLVRESAGYGVFMANDAYFGSDNDPDGDFARNTITGNANCPVAIYENKVGHLDASNDFTGNDEDFVCVGGGYEFVPEQTWQHLTVPYLILDQISVADGATLTIAPGTTLIFDQDAGLEAYGQASAIRAEGTASEPITFTAKQHVKGYWAGLHFNDSNSTNNVLRYVVVEYGGSTNTFLGADDYGNIVVSSAGNASQQQITIEDSTIQYSASWGISVAQETIFTINGVSYNDNTSGGFRQRP
ncbi:hypothetical protein [Oceanithermus sp.]